MQCNLNGGRIYKGSIAQIDVFLYPACYTGVTDVVANFYTVSGQSIQKTDMVIEDGIATVLFQSVEIETFEDGLLRYNVSYEVDGEPFTHDYETRWVIKTPNPYTPIDFVTTDELEDDVAAALTSETVVREIQNQVEQTVSGKADTTAVTQALATKQDKLTAGANIKIASNVISVTGMPDTSSFVNSGQVQTQINNSITGKQDTLVSGTNIKTVNNQSLLGSGNIVITSSTPTVYSAGTNIAITNNVISVTGITVPTSNTAFTNDANYVNSGQVQTQINNSISGLSPYTAGTNIQIADNVISVTGITSYTGITSQEVINALGYTPCKVTAITQSQYTNIQNKDANTIYGIVGE